MTFGPPIPSCGNENDVFSGLLHADICITIPAYSCAIPAAYLDVLLFIVIAYSVSRSVLDIRSQLRFERVSCIGV